MCDFIERSLLELTSFIVDNRGRTCPTADDGMPLIATNCLKEGKRAVIFENVRYVDAKTYSNWFRAHPEPGDVLFVCKGSPGRVAVVPDPVTYCIAQDMVALRADQCKVDPAYLYYRLRGPDVQSGIENMHVGTMIPHFKKGDFGKLRFLVHTSLLEQQSIAAVLSALDDKIAANERMCELTDGLLEGEFARLVEGCSWSELNTICDVNQSVRKPQDSGSLRYLDISSVGRGSYEFPELIHWSAAPGRARRGLSTGDTVWSTVRPNRRSHALVLDDDATLVASTGLAVLTPKAGRIAGLYEATRTESFAAYLESVAEGSAYPAVRADRFPLAPVPDLTPQQWDNFEGVALALRRRTHAAAVETRALSSIRDELLPLLMSGKLRVKEAESVVEAVV